MSSSLQLSANFKTRCSHLFPASGRRCRLLATDPDSGLCAHHLARQKALDKSSTDFFVPLMRKPSRFQCAQAINHSLNHLYELVARDRISTRRARTLAQISGLLLRTLPLIDSDTAKGIKDPLSGPPSLPSFSNGALSSVSGGALVNPQAKPDSFKCGGSTPLSISEHAPSIDSPATKPTNEDNEEPSHK